MWLASPTRRLSLRVRVKSGPRILAPPIAATCFEARHQPDSLPKRSSSLRHRTRAIGRASSNCVAFQFAISIATLYLVALVIEEVLVISGECKPGTNCQPNGDPFPEDEMIAEMAAVTAH